MASLKWPLIADSNGNQAFFCRKIGLILLFATKGTLGCLHCVQVSTVSKCPRFQVSSWVLKRGKPKTLVQDTRWPRVTPSSGYLKDILEEQSLNLE